MDVLELYRSCGAYLEGHYLLASGRHSPKFLQSLKVMQHPEHADALGTALAEQFEGISVDFVIGPAMGGVVLSHTVARALGARALFAEKDGRGEMEVRSAFGVAAGERFLAVEDVVTTGASLSKASFWLRNPPCAPLSGGLTCPPESASAAPPTSALMTARGCRLR